MRHDADHCPRCGRKITDYDRRGRELDSGQRECNGPCPGVDWTQETPHEHDTLRDELADAVSVAVTGLLPDLSEQAWEEITDDVTDAALPVVLRYARLGEQP